VDPASSCSIRAARSRCVSPLTPTPLPCQGRGELDADFRAKSRTQPPLPFEGRGDGGEGSKNPARASSTLRETLWIQHLRAVSVVRVAGAFHPSPRPSPLPGERGAGCGFQGEKQTLAPLSPSRGEGMGVRGQRTLPAPRQRLRGSVDPASSCTVRAARSRCVSPLTPDPSPLLGERGVGCGFRAKSNL
jgi:hypothetical protein